MEEWKLEQIEEINRFNGWLEAQIVDACTALDKCGDGSSADGSNSIDMLEDIQKDRIFQLRRMKDSLPKYLLSNEQALPQPGSGSTLGSP
jgi:hypothetical protein